MKKMKNELTESSLYVINKLKDFNTYIVGGSLRNLLINTKVSDVDIVTSASTSNMKRIFIREFINVGNEFGTFPILVNGDVIEVSVMKGNSIEEDLSVRDFTMNAIAYSVDSGIIDPFNGSSDINNRSIKTVGSPEARFSEDPLRIVRALRFASTLGFTIEKNTELAMFANKHLLSKVSPERLQKELNGVILGKFAGDVLVNYSSIIAEFVYGVKPMIGFDQKNVNHIYDVWEHSALVVQNAEDDLAHKLAGLFHDSGKPNTFTFDTEKQTGRFFGHAEESVKIAETALRKLRYSNAIRERVLDIIIDHDRTLSTKPYRVKKEIYEKGPERFSDMIRFKRADDSAKNPKRKDTYGNYDKIESIYNEFLDNNPILSHKDLEINVQDIIDLGIEGPAIGRALNELCLLVISGHKNSSESQINYLKKNWEFTK